jgi:hypothetical protein
MEYLVPEPFATGENWVISRFFGRNWWHAILRVQDPEETLQRPSLVYPTPSLSRQLLCLPFIGFIAAALSMPPPVSAMWLRTCRYLGTHLPNEASF